MLAGLCHQDFTTVKKNNNYRKVFSNQNAKYSNFKVDLFDFLSVYCRSTRTIL